MIEVTEAQYSSEYKLWVKFNNGKEGIVDLEKHLWGPAFEPLKNREFFKKVEVSKTLGTITWPNEVDFAPEFLLENISI